LCGRSPLLSLHHFKSWDLAAMHVVPGLVASSFHPRVIVFIFLLKYIHIEVAQEINKES
jgi:hypothetical protein